MSKREREGGGGGGGEEEDGDLYGAKSTVTGEREREMEREGGRFTHFRGKRHGIEQESDEDYKV